MDSQWHHEVRLVTPSQGFGEKPWASYGFQMFPVDFQIHPLTWPRKQLSIAAEAFAGRRLDGLCDILSVQVTEWL